MGKANLLLLGRPTFPLPASSVALHFNSCFRNIFNYQANCLCNIMKQKYEWLAQGGIELICIIISKYQYV